MLASCVFLMEFLDTWQVVRIFVFSKVVRVFVVVLRMASSVSLIEQTSRVVKNFATVGTGPRFGTQSMLKENFHTKPGLSNKRVINHKKKKAQWESSKCARKVNKPKATCHNCKKVGHFAGYTYIKISLLLHLKGINLQSQYIYLF